MLNDFSIDDVLKIAKAVTHDPLVYMYSESFTPYYFCNYCDAELVGHGVKIDDFVHDENCAVMVAQDIIAESRE